MLVLAAAAGLRARGRRSHAAKATALERITQLGAEISGIRRQTSQAYQGYVPRDAVGRLKVVPSRDVIPEELLSSKYERELVEGVQRMADTFHANSVAHMLQEVQKQSSSNLEGVSSYKAKPKAVRMRQDGTETVMTSIAQLVLISRWLKESFPDDLVYTDEDTEILVNDADFTEMIVCFLQDFGIMEDATTASVLEYLRHAGTYKNFAGGSAPRRVWAVDPLGTVPEYKRSQSFSSSVVLMEDGEPVLTFIACPSMLYSHTSRSKVVAGSASLFYAVKGLGAWSQLIILGEQDEVYSGHWRFKAKSMKLDCTKKLEMAKNFVFDALPTKQLHCGTGTFIHQNVYSENTTIAKCLGSEYPMFCEMDNAFKYCVMARGEVDVCWALGGCLHDVPEERTVDHMAGALLVQEANGEVYDFDGKPIVWRLPVLRENRGVFMADPQLVKKEQAIPALEEATVESQRAFGTRVEYRRYHQKWMSKVFDNLVDAAKESGEQELRIAKNVQNKAQAYLSDTKAMDDAGQRLLNNQFQVPPSK